MPAFSALIGPNARTLVLGSMPGLASLEARQYYAHPRNAFWFIMGQLWGFDETQPYQNRTKLLIKNRVAVWDVLHDCERPGSLDSRIVTSSEQPNDFRAFFTQHDSIQAVAFNGRAARTIFHRHCHSLYEEFEQISWLDLPSTSPAYAAMSVSEKTRIWCEKLGPK